MTMIAAFNLRTPTGAGNYTTLAYSLTISNGGTFTLKGNGTNTVNNLILNGGNLSQGETGANPDTATLAGSINLEANATINSGASGSGGYPLTLVIQAPITNSPGLSPTLTLSDNAGAVNGLTVVLAAQNTFNGGLLVTGVPGDTLKLGANNALPPMALLAIQGTAGSTGTTNPVFDLAGYSTAISNLVFSTSSNSGYVTNSSTSASTLTISNNAADTVQYGTIADNGANGGTLSLVKTGSGTLTLANTNTYSGTDTVSGGTLTLNGPGMSTSLVVTNGATCNVWTTKPVLANTATVSIGASSQIYLTNGVNQTVKYLAFNGQWQTTGTWGSTNSSAEYQTNYFSGTGILTISSGGEPEIVSHPIKKIAFVGTSGLPSLTSLLWSSNLMLSWPSNLTGFQLQVQTNGLVSSNWTDVYGSTATNRVIIPFNPANGSMFFRLVSP